MMKRLFNLVLVAFAIFGLAVPFTVGAQDDGPLCEVSVSYGEDGNGGNVWIAVSITGGEAWSWPQVIMSDGASFGFQLNENGDGNTNAPHYVVPGTIFTVSVEGYSGCSAEFVIELDDTGVMGLRQTNKPQNIEWYDCVVSNGPLGLNPDSAKELGVGSPDNLGMVRVSEDWSQVIIGPFSLDQLNLEWQLFWRSGGGSAIVLLEAKGLCSFVE